MVTKILPSCTLHYTTVQLHFGHLLRHTKEVFTLGVLQPQKLMSDTKWHDGLQDWPLICPINDWPNKVISGPERSTKPYFVGFHSHSVNLCAVSMETWMLLWVNLQLPGRSCGSCG